MAYIVPSVLVYQILATSGGVANSTPDLEACLIGPCYNVVRYISGDTVSSQATFTRRVNDFTTNNTITLNSLVAGQKYETSTLDVFLNNASIVSFSSSTVSALPGTTVISVTGGGLAGLSTAGTPVARPGDVAQLTYTPTGGGAVKHVESIIQAVTDLTVTISDMLPSDLGTVDSLNVVQTWNDVLVPKTSVNSADLQTTDSIKITAGMTTAYGVPLSGNVHVSYRALRTDLSGQIVTVKTPKALAGALQKVGDITEENPLALAGQIALANTVTQVNLIAVESDDLMGYSNALSLSEGTRLYSMVPLSQDPTILSLFKTHVQQMSTPELHSWRVTYVAPKIPTVKYIGTANEVAPNVGGQIVNTTGASILTYDQGTFISDGVVPSDSIVVTSASPTGAVKTYTVKTVLSNQQLELVETQTDATINAFYISRTLNRTAQAKEIAAMAAQANEKRYILTIPDTCGISVNGVVKYLPAYYLCAGLAGMTAGFPPQKGFTNIGIAGVADLRHSNFYFTRSDLNTMAAAGVFLWVQATQGGQPYCRHELTTDVSTLEYRELMKVKNWDFLSYYYFDKLTPFIGSWNLTPDTINTIRQTIIASSELVKSKRLPKIGAPLVSYSIVKIAQNPVNKDNLDVVLKIAMGDPNNYTNVYLTV